ncbi:MAG TPA: PVC-type heme-binding CxxCH protein [Candidatus Limnocylindrales bacterium]|nr:PVC-type heme-binding CxxCH protein [Candidatus Limnocylindrales bacterium]
MNGDVKQFKNIVANLLTTMLTVSCLAADVSPAPSGQTFPDDARTSKSADVERQDHPMTPAESLSRFKIANDLAIDQVLAEPLVRQPVFMNFDERGRLWVVEYLQYPFPAGLKMLSHDSFWRAVYDKVPPPPPHHFVGADKISIYEDTKGNGIFDKHKTFVEGLNIVTAVTKGRGGVWVLNPPYLLFYLDKNNDDIPDGDPEVILSGFGLEDTHSVVNSLRWGPDGWLYACQGSTVTASVLRPGLDKEPIVRTMGQQIWRYHPETKRFEVFSEGGGNAFGCEIDEKGRVFSGHNGGNTRGFHYMQGAYLQKGFDKHGPLSNPYAFGYFPPMPHPAVDRFTHNFIIYDGGALPPHYNGKLFGIEPLQGRVVESQIEPDGSSFRTWDLGYPVTTADRWFRPVDIKLGPDGAIYIADWYDGQVNHYHNHEGQIDRSNGRIYRLRSKDARNPGRFDLGKASTQDLIGCLGHTNKWFRQEALQLIADRGDRSVIAMLTQMVKTNTGQLSLECFWALNLSGGFTEAIAHETLHHTDPFVRLWTVRLLGDQNRVSVPMSHELAALAASEQNIEVRAQLACSAKRLPAKEALLIVKAMLARNEDASEKRMPLLLWWALESKCDQDRGAVLELFGDASIWRLPLVEQHILERLMHRFALAGTRADLMTCARLFQLAPGQPARSMLLAGFELGSKGRSLTDLPAELMEALDRASGNHSVTVGVRRGNRNEVQKALAVLKNTEAPIHQRLEYVEALGEVKQPEAFAVMLQIIADDREKALHRAALAGLQRFEEPEIGKCVVRQFHAFDDETQTAALSLLSSRAIWAVELLRAIDSGAITVDSVSQDALQKIKTYKDPRITDLVRKLWKSGPKVTTAEMKDQIASYAALIRNGEGNPYEGRKLFGMSCGLCHTLFGQGGHIGPDLTPYKRDDLDTILLNIVNPNAEIREGYETYLVTTKDGRTLSGLLADKDTHVVVLRGLDGINQTLPLEQIEEMKSAGLSLMPEGLLNGLREQQVRDLFAYLRSAQPLVGEPPKQAAR